MYHCFKFFVISTQLLVVGSCATANMSTKSDFTCNSMGATIAGVVVNSKNIGLIEGWFASVYAVNINVTNTIEGDCFGSRLNVLLQAGNPGYLSKSAKIVVYIDDVSLMSSELSNWQSDDTFR